MTEIYPQPLGLPDVHWEAVKCEILRHGGSRKESERIGVVEQTEPGVWCYTLETGEAGVIRVKSCSLLDQTLRGALGQEVSVRPVEWRCSSERGYKATVTLREDGTAVVRRGCYTWRYPNAYAAFNSAEWEVIRQPYLWATEAEAKACRAELERALDVLQGVLRQACGQGASLDTQGVGAYVQAARLLAYYGRSSSGSGQGPCVDASAPTGVE